MKTKNLLQSKKFWTAVGTVIAMVITSYLPATVEIQALIITLTGIVGYGVINGFSKQDVAQARAEIVSELAKPGNVDRVVNAAGNIVDLAEKWLRIDIPDVLETSGKEELRRILQGVVGAK